MGELIVPCRAGSKHTLLHINSEHTRVQHTRTENRAKPQSVTSHATLNSQEAIDVQQLTFLQNSTLSHDGDGITGTSMGFPLLTAGIMSYNTVDSYNRV